MGKAWSEYMAKNGKQEYEIGDPMTVIDQLRAELAAAKNLLARIHRDGGHHTEAVGVINSITDAHEKWSELLLENFNLTNELATARETIASAQEEIAAMRTERNATATEGDVVFKIQEAQRYGKG